MPEDYTKFYEDIAKEFNEESQKIIKKVVERKQLTEREIKLFLWDIGREVEENIVDTLRWTECVETIVEICGRYFMIDWRRGKTEMQENEFDTYPYEVIKHSYEKTIIVTEWKKA